MNNSTMINGVMTMSDNSEAKIPLIIIWIVIVIVGGVGNTLTIYVIYRRSVKSATIIYILSLAVADLAFLTTVVPYNFSLRKINVLVKFGDAVMVFLAFLQFITVHVTCWTLMAMTIDRYLAIVYPVKSLKWRTTKTSIKVSIGAWIVSGFLSIPAALPYTYNSDFLNAVAVDIFLTSFGIPLLVIIICYVKIISVIYKRNKEMLQKNTVRKTRRAVKMVSILILLFAFSWGPMQVLAMLSNLDPNFTDPSQFDILRKFLNTLAYTNSCINPFVYALMNKEIRKALASKLCIKHDRV
ncbi:G-protein coupled receptor 54-like [Saccostrea cucullata]|uniref:G-protein coupled receptor 54-like n=1 Tax=Saccostrea cuccullata TaxID=36930 RepID=UPI002ED4285E